MKEKENQNIEWKESWRDEYLNWICGMANGQGGKIYIGVDDKGVIVGVKNIKKLLVDLPNKIRNAMGIVAEVNHLVNDDGKEYVEISVQPHPFPVSCHGKYYLRSGSTLQLLSGASLDEFMLRKQGVTWDRVPVPFVEVDSLNDKAVEIFIDKAIQKGRLDSDIKGDTKEELIDRLNLFNDNYLTNAAILLFHKNPEKYIFGSFIKIGFFESDSEIVFQDEVHGSIIEQVDKTIELLYFKYLKAKIFYEGIQRVEKYPFPREAIREALLNAIVHKDYTSGVPIQISVYDDKMYIGNTGRLPQSWTLDKLMSKHVSIPHNPLIAHVFYLAGLIESWGRGIEKICNACLTDGIEPPKYIINPGDVMIMLAAPGDRVVYSSGRVEKDIYENSISKNPPATAENPPVNPPATAENPPVNPPATAENPPVNPPATAENPPVTKVIKRDINDVKSAILNFCQEYKSTKEIMEYFSYTDTRYFRKKYLRPLIDEGKLLSFNPDKPTDPNQKYIAKK